ncbi:hypothetical protein ACH5RR_025545 [Cinchona calisaya]|uniref:Uncharacterized protein n=1 Tax=Cinchona calisaya TaxID=153742 RepID=A0ABD2Z125_9GENT
MGDKQEIPIKGKFQLSTILGNTQLSPNKKARNVTFKTLEFSSSTSNSTNTAKEISFNLAEQLTKSHDEGKLELLWRTQELSTSKTYSPLKIADFDLAPSPYLNNTLSTSFPSLSDHSQQRGATRRESSPIILASYPYPQS